VQKLPARFFLGVSIQIKVSSRGGEAPVLELTRS